MDQEAKNDLGGALRAALPALALLAVAVTVTALVLSRFPAVPDGVALAGGLAVAAIALLLPGFRRIAAIDFLYENDIFFVSGVVAGLVWANVAPDSYEHFKHAKLELPFGIAFTFDQAVNDVLM